MKIIFSNHAKKRMHERGIKLQEIQETIEIPDYTIKKETKIEAIKKFQNHEIKIIYSEDKFIKIITVIKR